MTRCVGDENVMLLSCRHGYVTNPSW